MKNKTIGVLMGGLSPEREISIKSGKAVAKALREKNYNVKEVVVDQNIASEIIKQEIDVAWIALHGEFGEDGCIQGMLEIMGIPYTGSDVIACATSMDKRATKRALQKVAVCQPADQEWDAEKPFNAAAPIVIKDPLGGSSIGVWVCRTEAEKNNAVQECKANGGKYLVEEYIEGTEITVAVLEGRPLPVVTILPKGEFFDLKSKYTEGETIYLHPKVGEVISPESGIPVAIAEQAQKMAALAFAELGMSGVARADFIVPSSGKHPNLLLAQDPTPRFLEINAIPGMTATSLTPMAATAVGIGFADLVEKILLLARCKQVTGNIENNN